MKRLKINRIIITIMVTGLLLFGIYQTLSSLFVDDGFVETVSGDVIGTVVIDPGHGGNDVGAQYNDLYEKDLNLEYARVIGNYLMNNGVQVIYTRKTDERLGDDQNSDLYNRCLVGSDADYFISIHINSTEDNSDVKGFEVYYSTYNTKSKTLATTIVNNLDNLGYTNNRGIKNGNKLYVIRNSQTSPVLIELGYIQGDYKMLTSSTKKKKISKAIGDAIIENLK